MRNDFKLLDSKHAQITVFIILAIILVGVIVIYFLARGGISVSIPKEMGPVYSYYTSCIQELAIEGSLILGEQGGYINVPEFSPGNDYMPFSSQLSFLGLGVPYWYYISGNGVVNEQIPSLSKMETQLADYINEKIYLCDFSQFEEQGYDISFGEPEASASIGTNKISIDVKQDLDIVFGDKSFNKKTHSTAIDSNLGKFYNLASKIYEAQKQTMFLENYGVDILRLYAPVDGSEIGCSPKVWSVNNIRGDLINALSANIPAVKIKGDYYTLKNNDNKYFIRDIGENVDVDVNFLYLQNWPMKLEVWPSEDGLLIAEPVGLQEGLGMLGFCYVSYHFVYDFAYPVMVQIYSGNEMFQFPVVVSIDKNNPRKALDVEGLPDVVPELCEHKLNKIKVSTYNTELDAVEARIKFKCFDTTCSIGDTKKQGNDSFADAVLDSYFPQCVNGYILASAEGYKTKKYLSQINENNVIIILDKKYKLDLEVKKAGSLLSGDYAVVTFTKDNETTTVVYPEQKQIELTEGDYNVKVYIYSNASIALKGSSSEKCIDIPKTGILGMFGATEKKCFTMTVPDQTVSFAVSGGGSRGYYITESELKSSRKIIINSDFFGIPRKVEDLQLNYNKIETSSVEVRLE